MLINLLILAFFIPFLTMLPFNKSSSLIILDHFFNTNIFIKKDLLSIASLGPILAIVIILTHYIIKFLHSPKSTSSPKKVFKIFHVIPFRFLLLLTISLFISTTIAFFIPSSTNIKIIILSYLITALIFLLSNNKKGQKKITELNLGYFIICILSHFLLFIPSFTPFLITLFIGKLLHIKKEENLILALLYYLPYLIIDFLKLSSSISSNLITTNYLIPYLISIILSTVLSLVLYKYFKKLYLQNRLTKLAFITFILSIFFLYWFR